MAELFPTIFLISMPDISRKALPVKQYTDGGNVEVLD